MKVYQVRFKETKHLRVEVGYMDSQPTGTEIVVSEKNVIASAEEMAVAYVKMQHGHDTAFQVLSNRMVLEVDAIVQVDHGLGPTLR